MDPLIAEIAGRLTAGRQRLITAESCTGGLIAARLTAVPGSSDWFEGAFVTYRLSAKQRMLGVRAQTLERYSAVSEPVAREMAQGALARSEADVAVSVTGLAGPGGGDPMVPVGYVWVAWADRRRGFVQADRLELQGTRAEVREQAATAALEGVVRLLEGSVPPA